MTAGSDDWALFLDFDGTLVDIVERPEAVLVEPGLTDALARLRDRLGGALALVSGREIAVLDGFLQPLELDAAGMHGLEHRMGGAYRGCRPEEHPRLRAGVEALKARFGTEPGILIEDKGCAVALHWRLAPERAEEVRGEAQTLAQTLGSAYRLQQGKAVAEILPASAGKGKVIAMFLEQAPYRGRRPIFVGDDLTDEHGFETVNGVGGLSVRIGPGETIAHRRLASPAEFRRHLFAWAKGAPIGFPEG
jgi:trehalose 6-phosphate phosphatase